MRCTVQPLVCTQISITTHLLNEKKKFLLKLVQRVCHNGRLVGLAGGHEPYLFLDVRSNLCVSLCDRSAEDCKSKLVLQVWVSAGLSLLAQGFAHAHKTDPHTHKHSYTPAAYTAQGL